MHRSARARNRHLAEALEEVADLLRQQESDPFRISAYERAADTLRHLDRDAGEILEREGMDGLLALPHVGYGIAGALREMLVTGRWGQLERLRGTSDPVRLFQRVPGIGPCLALRLHEDLDLDTLEQLELACHDQRLRSVRGVGPRRAAQIRAAVESLLSRRPRRPEPEERIPPVEVLLDVDREYHESADAGRLPVIAPRRFNPEGKAWLPVLHTRRGRWSLTALFSNTARAHELGRTRDWVVIYSYDDHHRERQHTVVTETRGPLAGQRVVRGREAECREHYGRAA
jgi:hypothetical protein